MLLNYLSYKSLTENILVEIIPMSTFEGENIELIFSPTGIQSKNLKDCLSRLVTVLHHTYLACVKFFLFLNTF